MTATMVKGLTTKSFEALSMALVYQFKVALLVTSPFRSDSINFSLSSMTLFRGSFHIFLI
jgi:hypothetical protein